MDSSVFLSECPSESLVSDCVATCLISLSLLVLFNSVLLAKLSHIIILVNSYCPILPLSLCLSIYYIIIDGLENIFSFLSV